MITLFDARKRLVTILAVVMIAVLVGCASSSGESPDDGGGGGDQTCDECNAGCESLSGEEKADCLEKCVLTCLP